jgi:hypothetical protein
LLRQKIITIYIGIIPRTHRYDDEMLGQINYRIQRTGEGSFPF